MKAILLSFICFCLLLFARSSPLSCICPRRLGCAGFYVKLTINVMPIDASTNGRRDFVLANTRLIAPPLTPEVRLMLRDEAVPIWKKTEGGARRDGAAAAVLGARLAGGQAVARYALDNPALLTGKRARDFASGSGLVAIAAAKAGAAETTASDIDPFAIAAIEANATENGVSIAPRLENLIGADEGWEVVLAGDIAYEKDLAGAAMDWLGSPARRGATVLIGDPRRSYLPHERLDCVIEYSVPVTRELEDSEIKRTGVFRFP
jgi:predicted nicotinamide N-methyase